MSLVGATRLARFPHLATRRPLARPFSTAAPPRPRSGYARHLIAAGLLSSVAGGSLYAYKNSSVIYADVGGHEANGRVSQVPPPPLSELVRTYIVYSLCSVPFLVDWSPTILSTLMAIPGLKQITEAVVRVTFFDQVRSQLALSRVISVHPHCSSSVETRPRMSFLYLSACAGRTRVRSLCTVSKSTNQQHRGPGSSRRRRSLWRISK